MPGKRDPLLEKVGLTIGKYGLLPYSSQVVVGVSGGPDSVALLHILYRLKSVLNLKLWVAHLNHKLRPGEAEREASWTKRFASKLGIAVISDSFDVPLLAKKKGLSIETAARQARYNFLEHVAVKVGASKIALGHTASDQVETVLMRFLRGSGLEGLSGIPPARGKIIRPLIGVFREEVEQYCQDNFLDPCFDSSNRQRICLRNRVRLDLIPYLSGHFNPQLESSLFRLLQITRADNEYLQGEARRVWKSLIVDRNEGKIILNFKKLSSLHLALQRRVIRLTIETIKGDLRGISFRQIKSLLELNCSKGTRIISLPGNLRVEGRYGQLVIKKKKKEEDEVSLSYGRLRVPGETKLSELNLRFRSSLIKKTSSWLSKNPNFAFLDHNKISGSLFFRSRKIGDRFQPLGMVGTKKLKDFFIDLKIPRFKRDKIPLLVSKSEIVWVVGQRISERFKIDENTKKILKIEVREENG